MIKPIHTVSTCDCTPDTPTFKMLASNECKLMNYDSKTNKKFNYSQRAQIQQKLLWVNMWNTGYR